MEQLFGLETVNRILECFKTFGFKKLCTKIYANNKIGAKLMMVPPRFSTAFSEDDGKVFRHDILV
jgi:hypothetical protein